MRKRSLFTFLCLLLASTAAYGGHYSDTYVIPVAGHVPGVNGTLWKTDVVLRNFQASPLEVEFIVIESGFNPANNVYPLMTDAINGSVVVPPNGTILMEDIMAGHRGMTASSGSLVVGADLPFSVTSRTYNDKVPLGQTVPAARDFLVNSFGEADNQATAYIPGIASDAGKRTNVGFTAGNGGSVPLVVEVLIRNASGEIVGMRSISVPPATFMHLQFAVGPLLQPDTSLDLGSADVRIVEGEGALVPYASVIDNATDVATYIMGQLPEPVITTTTSAFWPENVFQLLLKRGGDR